VGAGARGDTDTLTTGPLSRSRPRPLAMLVTPTTSTPVQDNISLIFPLVFHLASTHLGRGPQQQIHWLADGPRGSETPTSLLCVYLLLTTTLIKQFGEYIFSVLLELL
jgi:hypothetical protein